MPATPKLDTDSMDSPPLDVLVIDDVELAVDGTVSMLERFPRRLRVVGAPVGRVSPVSADVALVDSFGHADAGLDRARTVLDLGTVRHVALFTWRITPAQAVKAADMGVTGILSKASAATDLVRDIERVSSGEMIVANFPFHACHPTWLASLDTDLSTRELELLAFVADGLDNRDIAAAMYLAESSVKTYLKRVYRKLGINSRAQAVIRAVELGIAGPNAGPNVGIEIRRTPQRQPARLQASADQR